jgi:hypothetical protein
MKIFIISTILISMLICNQTKAQDLFKNNQKYWYYKERLSWFMNGIGPNSGQSMPGKTRDANQVSYDDNLNNLGWYIGVLATEWKLLHDEGSDTKETERELFYALYALRRLDNTDYCEPGYGCIGNISNDGMFLREDAPINVQYLNPIPSTSPLLPTGYNKPFSNVFKNNGYNTKPSYNNPDDKGKYGCADFNVPIIHQSGASTIPFCNTMSQDHAIRVMMGLALVSKLVDVNANYNGNVFQDGYTSLQGEAKQIAFDMVRYFQKGNWLLYRPGKYPGFTVSTMGAATITLGWLGPIVSAAAAISTGGDPTVAEATTVLQTYTAYTAMDLVATIGWGEYDNLLPRGNCVMKYGYAWAQAGKKVCGGTNQFLDAFTTTPSAVFLWKCNAFSDYTIIGGQELPIDHSNCNMSLTLACIGDSWNFGQNTTGDYIHQIENRYGWDGGFYSLLWANLQNQSLNSNWLTQSDVENVLNSAPCDGPNNTSSDNWHQDNRFVRNSNNPINTNAAFSNPGLDYMLLYNLYYLYYRNSLPKYFTSWDNNGTNVWYRDHFDLTDPSHTLTFPMTLPSSAGSDLYSQIGTTAHPLSIRAEDYIIDGTTQILAGSNVSFRCGNSTVLQLTPGFYAAPSSNWDASKNLFQYSDCSPTTGNYDRVAHFNTNDTIVTPPISNFMNHSFVTDAFINIAPNPFLINTVIQVYLPSTQASAQLLMYNMLGEQVRVIINSVALSEGMHQYTIDRNNLSSGIYQLQLKTESGVINKQIVIQ